VAIHRSISKSHLRGSLITVAILAGGGMFAQSVQQPRWFRPELNDRYESWACGMMMGPSSLLPHERFPTATAHWKNESRRILTTVVTDRDEEPADAVVDNFVKNKSGRDYVDLIPGERFTLREFDIAWFTGPKEIKVRRFSSDGERLLGEETVQRSEFALPFHPFRPGLTQISLHFEIPKSVANLNAWSAWEEISDYSYKMTAERSADDPTRMTLRVTDSYWRPAPLSCRMSVSHGEAEVKKLELTPNARADFERISLMILESQPGRYELDPSSEATSGNYNWFPQTSEGQSLWYVISPSAQDPNLNLTFLDANGSPVEGEDFGRRVMGSGLYFSPEVNAPKQLQVAYSPYNRTVWFYTPPLTGLPEVNHGVKNLFEIRIPYLEANSPEDLMQAVAKGSALGNYMDVEFEFPEGYFPHTYTDVTINDLLAELQRHSISEYGGRATFIVDLREGCIREPIPVWERLQYWWDSNF